MAEAEDEWEVAFDSPDYTFGMVPWLELAPSDTTVDLPAFCLIEPEKHEPVKSSFLGEFYRWGLDNGEDSGMFEASCKRTLDAMYKDSPSPEKQYVGYLMEKKMASLQDEEVLQRAAELEGCDMILRVALVAVDDASPRGEASRLQELKPRSVWRRVRVRGDLTLRELHELCLRPAMGWAEGCHGYVFTDAMADGAQWGPKGCSYPDLANLDMYGYDFMDDSAAKIGQVLRHPGDYILYDYDLLEQFMHRVTLESVTDPSTEAAEPDNYATRTPAAVLDGEMACPPEDSTGLPISGSLGHGSLLKFPRGSPHLKGCCRAASTAANVKGTLPEGASYDPYRFSVTEANARVATAAVAASRQQNTEQRQPAAAADEGGSSDLERLMSGLGLGSGAHPRERCAHCGAAGDLMQCTRCKIVQYCSKDCQKADWKIGHKNECQGPPE